MWYGGLTGFAFVTMMTRSFILDIPRHTLPFKAWLPYNHDTSQIGFWLAYFHQVIACGAGAFVNIAFDTLVPGLLMQTGAQIKILKLRLYAIPKKIGISRKSCRNVDDRECQVASQLLESELVAECIRHHLVIYQFDNYNFFATGVETFETRV